MKRTRLDAEPILRQRAEIRRAIPRVAPAPPAQRATAARATWTACRFGRKKTLTTRRSRTDCVTGGRAVGRDRPRRRGGDGEGAGDRLVVVSRFNAWVTCGAGGLAASRRDAGDAGTPSRSGGAAERPPPPESTHVFNVTRHQAAEELARDPAHAELILHVERMRAAYERGFWEGDSGAKG